MSEQVLSTVRKGGTCACMTRVTNEEGTAITQATISSVTYSVYLLDDADPDSRTAVSGHSDVSLTVTDVVSDSTNTTMGWTEDSTGWNFRHVVDVSSNAAFAVAGRRYLIEFTLTPTSGQVIVLQFIVTVF